jgi:hypothetical protein
MIVNHFPSGVKTLTATFLGTYLNYTVISSIKYYLSNIISQVAYYKSKGAAQKPEALGSIVLYGLTLESDKDAVTLT